MKFRVAEPKEVATDCLVPAFENGATMIERTVQDFVEDMVSDNKEFKLILAVAQNTRWYNRLDEIKNEFQLLKNRMQRN